MMNNLVIQYIRRLTSQNRDTKDILSSILFFSFAYSLGKGIVQVSEGTSLGGLFRIFLPSIFCLFLFIFFSLIDLIEIKNLFSLGDIKFKQLIYIIAIVLLFAYPLVMFGSNYGLTDCIISMVVIIGFFTSIYYTIIGKSSLGVAIFLLTFPFINFFEYYYGNSYAFFRGIEWGPIILTPTITFLLILFFVSLIRKSRQKPSRVFRSPVTKALLVFFFVLFISSLCSKQPVLSIRYFILMWAYPFILFVIILRNIRMDDDLGLLLHSIITCICLISFFNLYFYFRSAEEAFRVHNIYGSILAANVTTGAWGQITAMTLPLSIILFLLSKVRGKIVYILVVAFLFLSVLLSFSRIAMIALVFALPILLKERKLRAFIFSFAIILILVFALHKPLFFKYVIYRFQHIRSFEDVIYDSSLQARLEGAKAALGMVKDYPLLGIGSGMWKDYVPYYAKMQQVVIGTDWGGKRKYGLGYIEDAHSIHFQVAADSGLLGFTAWIFILTMIFREAFYVLRKSRDWFRRNVILGALCSFVFFVIASISGGFDLRLFLGVHFMFWIVVAIIIKLKALEQLTQETEVATANKVTG